MKRLTLVLLAIGIAAITIIVVIFATGHAHAGQLGFEVIKLLVQFLLVGVLGVVISLLVQHYNQQRDKELLINELRKTVLAELIKAYSDTKKARRIIMAGRLANSALIFSVYDEQLKSIINTQLALEILNHKIKTSKKYFGQDASTKVIAKVEAMEKYLGELIDEYKDATQGFTSLPDSLPLSALPKLDSGMGKRNETNNFGKEFVENYRRAVEEIRSQILN